METKKFPLHLKPNEYSTVVSTMDKKQAIFKAMMELVTENGFHATPMSLVAKKANVAAGTIYHYFESKEQLINALYAQLKQQMGEAMLSKDDASKNYKERFFLFWFNLYEFFLHNPQEFLFLEQYANSPFIHQVVKEENRHAYQPVIDFMNQGMKSGVLREMNIELMTALVYGSVVSTVKLALSEEVSMNKSLLQSAVQSCWDGVKIT